MKSKISCWLILFFVSCSVLAQSDSTFSKATYFNSVHAGGLLGKKGHGSSLTASTIHGIRIKRISLGIGAGYDAYLEWRTLPVFGSVGYDFLPLRQNAFFLQFNAGYSKAWNPHSNDDQYIFDEEGGTFIHPLVGYRIHSNKFSLHLTAGYKFQNMVYEQTPRWWAWPGSKATVERDIERISIQLGFGFR